jgi:hypothetical protein
MSWDVHVIRLDRPAESVEDLPQDFVPPPIGASDDVRAAISKSFPATDWTDPSWGVCDREGFALEFSLGRDEPVDSFGILVHGSGDPVTPLLHMCAANDWQALDVQTGEFLDPRTPERSSWAKFCEWRDRVIKE